MEDSLLILPGNPLFNFTLQTAPHPELAIKSAQDGAGCALVVDHETGILRPANGKELADYLYGGEYDERLTAIGEEDFEDEWE